MKKQKTVQKNIPPVDKELILRKLRHNQKRVITTVKWVVFSVVTGCIVGFAASLFSLCLNLAAKLRLSHPVLLLFLPVGAMGIVALYRCVLKQKDPGTNLILSAIHSGDNIPLRMAPLISVATIFTHLIGGSAGREGAALQLGGSLGHALGQLFHFGKHDRHVMIMCGMSAAFSALFGTPLAAAVFSMEIVSVGIMHYAALLPCAISALIARSIASFFHLEAPFYVIEEMPSFALLPAVKVCTLAILCSLLSILFCILLHQSQRLLGAWLKNPYLRAFACGSAVLALTFAVGNQTYNGAGTEMIVSCMNGTVPAEAFLLKMLFTAITLAAGYKGGEIVPTFFIGATFGCLFGNLIHFAPALCTAAGMGALFCGVTNAPLTSLLICLELFGSEGMPYFLLSVAFSYMVSGYYGLYSSQRIVYSKYKSDFINKQAQ